jgi:hypothetical protein
MGTTSGLILRENLHGGGIVQQRGLADWHLFIPGGKAGIYRLAQLDDYSLLPRSSFPWSTPFRISLNARSSSHTIPGTWGFGLWNDPFGFAIVQGNSPRFPTLPNAAWFFFASEPNYLSLRDDLPARGQLAATFSSQGSMSVGLLVGLPLFSLVFLRPIARRLRHWLRNFVSQDTAGFDLAPTEWHAYEIEWYPEQVTFRVDGLDILKTNISPPSPLGFVAWIDNQYAKWTPDGHIGFGTLANPDAAWLEIKSLEMTLA